MSCVIRKFSICENKGADQPRGNREADQHLCFRYKDSTIPLLPKSIISSLMPSSVSVQSGLCRPWSETLKTGFLTMSSYILKVVFYMGLLQFALGLSRTKGESPNDSYRTKPRENPVIKMETGQEGGGRSPPFMG